MEKNVPSAIGWIVSLGQFWEQFEITMLVGKVKMEKYFCWTTLVLDWLLFIQLTFNWYNFLSEQGLSCSYFHT